MIKYFTAILVSSVLAVPANATDILQIFATCEGRISSAATHNLESQNYDREELREISYVFEDLKESVIYTDEDRKNAIYWRIDGVRSIQFKVWSLKRQGTNLEYTNKQIQREINICLDLVN